MRVAVFALTIVIAFLAAIGLWPATELGQLNGGAPPIQNVRSGGTQLNMAAGASVENSGTAPDRAIDPSAIQAAADRSATARYGGLSAQSTNIGRVTAEELANPAFRNALRAQYLRALRKSHIDLEKVMDLSRQEADAVLDLLAKGEMDARSYVVSSSDRGNHEAARASARTQIEARQKTAQDLANLLGAKKYEEWKTYEASLPARTWVRDVGLALDATLYPLNEHQVEPLVDAISHERQRQQQAALQRQSLVRSGDVNALARFDEDELERAIDGVRRIASLGILLPEQKKMVQEWLEQDLQLAHSRQLGSRQVQAAP